MKSSVRRKVLGIVGAIVAIFGMAIVVPAGDAAAAKPKTVAEAKAACKSLLGDKYDSSYWKVTGSDDNKKTGKCTHIKSAKRDTCTDAYKGTASSIENGKFTCTWKKLKKQSSSGSGSSGSSSSSSSSGSSSGGSSGSTSNSGDCVKTSILGSGGQYCDDGEGKGVFQILLIIFNILSAGVGVLGVVGLVISGLTYLTARDNEQQVAKAKNRILQIVIGLAIYAVLYVALQWLIPGGIFGS